MKYVLTLEAKTNWEKLIGDARSDISRVLKENRIDEEEILNIALIFDDAFASYCISKRFFRRICFIKTDSRGKEEVLSQHYLGGDEYRDVTSRNRAIQSGREWTWNKSIMDEYRKMYKYLAEHYEAVTPHYKLDVIYTLDALAIQNKGIVTDRGRATSMFNIVEKDPELKDAIDEINDRCEDMGAIFKMNMYNTVSFICPIDKKTMLSENPKLKNINDFIKRKNIEGQDKEELINMFLDAMKKRGKK